MQFRLDPVLLVHFLVTLLDDITGVESRPEAVTDLLEENIRDFRLFCAHEVRTRNRGNLAFVEIS